jgi:hypothetical protein
VVDLDRRYDPHTPHAPCHVAPPTRVRASPAPTDAAVLAALAFAHLTPLVSDCGGLDEACPRVLAGLSVGQCQRLGLARMHLQRPALVLLDEATSAVTSEFEAQVVDRGVDVRVCACVVRVSACVSCVPCGCVTLFLCACLCACLRACLCACLCVRVCP